MAHTTVHRSSLPLSPILLALLSLFTLAFSIPEVALASPPENQTVTPFSTLPDLTVTPAVSTITIIPGQGAIINFTLTSINGFKGNVRFRTESYPYGGSMAYFFGGVSADLVPGGTAKATLSVGYPVNGMVSRGNPRDLGLLRLQLPQPHGRSHHYSPNRPEQC